MQQNRSYTLFATHYFELTQLPQNQPACANVHLSAVEHKDSIVFLHSVQEGPASQSYGLQVAQLAGVPAAVIRAARKHLAALEAHSAQTDRQFDLFVAGSDTTTMTDLPVNPALEALQQLDPDTLSPRDALEALYRLKRLSSEEGQS